MARRRTEDVAGSDVQLALALNYDLTAVALERIKTRRTG